MEFEFDFRKYEKAVWQAAAIISLLVVIVILGAIGRGLTALDTAGNPQILSWSGWRLLQAQHAYDAELSLLRADVMRLAALLNGQPNPVAAQILSEAIARHTASGDPSLASARSALAAASLAVRDWATGASDRSTAVQSVQNVFTLLK